MTARKRTRCACGSVVNIGSKITWEPDSGRLSDVATANRLANILTTQRDTTQTCLSIGGASMSSQDVSAEDFYFAVYKGDEH